MEVRDLEVLAWRLFEESNDAVFLLDSETETIQQANPAAQRLTGLRGDNCAAVVWMNRFAATVLAK